MGSVKQARPRRAPTSAVWPGHHVSLTIEPDARNPGTPDADRSRRQQRVGDRCERRVTFHQVADAALEGPRHGVAHFEPPNATVVLRSPAKNPPKAHLDIPAAERASRRRLARDAGSSALRSCRPGHHEAWPEPACALSAWLALLGLVQICNALVGTIQATSAGRYRAHGVSRAIRRRNRLSPDRHTTTVTADRLPSQSWIAVGPDPKTKRSVHPDR